MSLAGAGVADHEHVFPGFEVFPGGELPDQGLVDRALGAKIEVLQRLEHRELRALDAALGRSLFALDQLTLGELEQKVPVIASVVRTRSRHRFPFPPDRRQPEFFEVMFEQQPVAFHAHATTSFPRAASRAV